MSDFRHRYGRELERVAAALPADLRVPTEAERRAFRARLRQEAMAPTVDPGAKARGDELRRLLREELHR